MNRMGMVASSAVLATFVAACGADVRRSSEAAEEQPQTHAERGRPAPRLAVRWRPVDHTVASDGRFFRGELAITNEGSVPLPTSGWTLYFNFVRRILRDGEGGGGVVQDLASQGLRVGPGGVAASGDYTHLEPLPGFRPIAPGETRVVSLLATNWAIQKTDAPAGFHLAIAGRDAPVFVRASVDVDPNDPKQTTRFAGDVLPVATPARRFEENAALHPRALALRDTLVPAPLSAIEGRGALPLDRPVRVDTRGDDALAREAAYLRAVLAEASDVTAAAQADVRACLTVTIARDARLDVTGDGAPDAEGYTLTVDARGVRVVGADAAGVFWGIQTLRQLLTSPRARDGAAPMLPMVTISDAPLFRYRGMMLDVARHFQTKATVEKLIDLLAFHKINALHLHLADDEGWRLEIPGLPELTAYGARRGFDPGERHRLQPAFGSTTDLRPGGGIAGMPFDATEANGGVPPRYQGFETATLDGVGRGSGHYTTADFEEILAYAAERHVEVIPEIDLPGHARAAVRAMEARYERYHTIDPAKAAQYRLVDPEDTSHHVSVQGYVDNFVNPCLESTYAFLAKVAREIRARYEAAGAHLGTIHGGGDELPALGPNVWWQGSPACRARPETRGLGDVALRDLFFTRWSAIVAGTGATMAGWDDVIHDGLRLPGFVAMPWSNVWGWGREDDAYRYANAGQPVILAHATNLYMDLAYEKDPDEPGYYWAGFVDEKKTFEYLPFDVFALATEDAMGHPIDPATWAGKARLTDAGKRAVLGMEGLLWGENVKSPELLEYMAFPKVLGVAERAWSRRAPTPDEMPSEWERFVNTLAQAELPRLDRFRPIDLRGELPPMDGVNYRIPPAGARLRAGVLEANVRYPGMAIELSTDGGIGWREYHHAVPVAAASVAAGKVLVRVRARDGRVGRASTVR